MCPEDEGPSSTGRIFSGTLTGYRVEMGSFQLLVIDHTSTRKLGRELLVHARTQLSHEPICLIFFLIQ